MATDVLTGMRVFATVVDLGSFAKAADKLDLSRGMTSRYVAQIENHLGVRLLNRTTRRLSLTEAGNDYYQRASQVLAMVEEAEHAATRAAAQPRGTLRVNASLAFGISQLGEAVAAYLNRHPQIRIDMTLNDRVLDLVEDGFDLGVRIAREIDPGLVARPIARVRLVACASPAYIKKRGAPKSPSELAEHNCLTYAYSGVPDEWRFTRARKEIAIKVVGKLHGNSGHLLCRAATAGLGVIVQPTFLVHEFLRAKKLVRILNGWEVDPLTVYAVYPNRQFLPAKVRTFIDFMVEHFGATPPWDRGID